LIQNCTMRIEINPNPQFILMNEWGKINNKRKKKRKEREKEMRGRKRKEGSRESRRKAAMGD